jgi:YD repeat-containing protein
MCLASGIQIASQQVEGGSTQMKKTLLLGALGSLLTGGLLLASTSTTGKVDSLSSLERYALQTQSPRVYTRGMQKHKKYDAEGRLIQNTRPGYRTVSTHTTVNAFIPMGK